MSDDDEEIKKLRENAGAYKDTCASQRNAKLAQKLKQKAGAKEAKGTKGWLL